MPSIVRGIVAAGIAVAAGLGLSAGALVAEDPVDLGGDVFVDETGTLDAAAVTVRVVARSVQDVLIVPVAALMALAEGGYALQDELGALHAVEVGLVADDRVEVSGDGVDAGMTVVTAR